MKNNTIDKIKLMMSYKMDKTLTENKIINNIIKESDVEIDEQGVAVKDLVAAGKVGRDLKAGLNDLAKGAIKDNKAILVRDVKGTLVPAKTGDEIINAIKKGTISAEELAKVNFGLFKSVGASENTLKLLATDIVESSKFMNEYKKVWDPNNREKLKNILKGRGYSESGSEALIKKIETNKYWKEIDASKSKISDLTAKNASKLKASEAENAKLREELKNSANISKESAVSGLVSVAGNPSITSEVKAVAQEASTVVKEMKPSRYQRWKEWAKKNPKTNKALIFLGLTATGWVLYKMFSSNSRRDEVKKTLFANCAGDLLDTQNSKILSMEDGSPVIYVSPTGNEEYDSKKGLKFFSNNRVLSGDNTMRGTWGCKGSTIGVQSEQTTGLPGVDLGLGTLSRIAQNREINKAESVGRVLNKINITWDTKSTDGGGGGGKDNGSGGGGTKNTIPTELKDVDGVKKFQTWLDSKHGGWHTKYGTLNDNTLKGWGKYGPNTTKAWSQYKDEYLNGSTASGTETPIPSTGVDVTKPSGIPGSPDMVGKSGLNLDVNRIKVTKQDVNNEIDKKIQPSNTELTDREKEILSNVKSRGADKVYKGGTLTPEEQQWLSKYYGGVIKKIKNEKGYGQKTVIDVPKKDTTSNEPLNEENIIKKIVSKNLKSLIK
jgi:hypothetical protein